MKKRIVGLVDQLSNNEQKDLHTHIKRQYAVEDRTMLRDDIKDKLIELIQTLFDWIEIINEKDSFEMHNIAFTDLIDLSIEISDSFNISHIDTNDMRKWNTAKDIVDHIEDNVSSEPYISGFEVESYRWN